MSKGKADSMKNEKHIAELIAEYIVFTGARSLDLQPGIWENNINENWKLKFNPHNEIIDDIPEYSYYLEHSGWPAGIMSVYGEGFLAAGSYVNEENLRKAIEAKMYKILTHDNN